MRRCKIYQGGLTQTQNTINIEQGEIFTGSSIHQRIRVGRIHKLGSIHHKMGGPCSGLKAQEECLCLSKHSLLYGLAVT